MTREEAYAAVFALLDPLAPAPGGDGTFITVSRRLELVETFDTNSMPAIFQQQLTEPGSEMQFAMSEGFVFSVLNLCWYIYVQQSDPTAPMTPALNGIIENLYAKVFGTTNADGVPPAFQVTVGEQVIAVRPTGILFWEGLLGDRAVARINLQAKAVCT